MRQHVLIVVAIKMWAELLELQIGRLADFEVIGSAPDGMSALREVERNGLVPCIVVIDVNTPQALPTASAVHRSHPSRKLVAVGLDESPGQAIAWATAGAVGLIGRTASHKELLSALSDVAGGGTHCSVGISSALLRGIGSTNGGARLAANGAPLTRREEEVARLVAGGFTNKEIAERLQVSHGTVKSHVHNVIHKLGVARRAHVAGKMPQQGAIPVLTAQRSDRHGTANFSALDQANEVDQPAFTVPQL